VVGGPFFTATFFGGRVRSGRRGGSLEGGPQPSSSHSVKESDMRGSKQLIAILLVLPLAILAGCGGGSSAAGGSTGAGIGS